jgi:transketolase
MMNEAIRRLEDIARLIRIDIVTMIHKAGDGHPGAALSAADIITALYFHAMNIDPAYPDKKDRDRFILSKGHGCPAPTIRRAGHPARVKVTLNAAPA